VVEVVVVVVVVAVVVVVVVMFLIDMFSSSKFYTSLSETVGLEVPHYISTYTTHRKSKL
jgi:uncharacterized membrane protein